MVPGNSLVDVRHETVLLFRKEVPGEYVPNTTQGM